MSNYRNPSVAGLFYSANPDVLKDEINSLLADTKPLSTEFTNVFGIVAPHAGYIYSGKTAAYAYSQLLDKRIETAVIISPSHREYFKGSCIYSGDGYITPLGKIEINFEMRDKIINGSSTVFKGIEGHRKEHAIEVQLPFLQVISGNIKIVPVVMGDQNIEFVEDLGKSIADNIDNNTVIVASSDLSHFYPREKARMLDSVVEKYFADMDYSGLINNLVSRKCEACGGGAIAALLKAAEYKNLNKSKVLYRTDSGEVSGDLNEVVGYLSAVIYN